MKTSDDSESIIPEIQASFTSTGSYTGIYFSFLLKVSII